MCKRVGKTEREKERGRRKRTDRAKKWRECALMMRFDSVITPQKSTIDWDEDEFSIVVAQRREEKRREAITYKI